nr:RNA-directed DNA polymerase, eukaryota, reverse transcriptase zinc-binding domain protein [Tanacetum cinerariifolium]
SFHYWFKFDGFEEMISKAWCESPAIEVNPMLKLMYKIKFLKKRIREWNGMRQISKSKKTAYKKELHDLETIIDQGNATDDMLYKRIKIIKAIQEVDKVDNMEAAQKAKIKWAIEGDENTKYYHGILNKKRNQLAIHGVLKDGIWIENPNLVKSDVLSQFGFGSRWCGWIQECLRSFRGLVLVNGSPTEEFQFYKGLKQGDPLSPFLFILVLESLHLSFKIEEDTGMFNGIMFNYSMLLSHMFYADDAIFMGQWSNRNIDTLIYMLKCFQRASGLSINLSKSNLIGIVVSVEKVEEVTKNIGVEDAGMFNGIKINSSMALSHMFYADDAIFMGPWTVSIEKVEEVTRYIGCGILNTPFSFLGSKVGRCMSRIKSWDEVIDKMVNRLSKWKMKLCLLE